MSIDNAGARPGAAAGATTTTARFAALADAAPYRSLQRPPGARHLEVIDQRLLPHRRHDVRIDSTDIAARAIREMWVRGAPLIGAVGAYGLAMALEADPCDASIDSAYALLDATRPTAVNLRWALARVRAKVRLQPLSHRAFAAWEEADAIVAEDVAINHAIGVHGLALLRAIAARKGGTVNVMTHCNAGALATCGHGTATAPIFFAHAEGIPVHVIVSETRPRLQGANLTAWEMREHAIVHTLVVDGASASMMQRGDVDVVIVGTDRVTRNGDVCNKIGTYAKALAARDNGVPFFVALPSPTIDTATATGGDIPIERRDAREVTSVRGRTDSGAFVDVEVAPTGTTAVNDAFDVTPARLVTGLLTERGMIDAREDAIRAAFPERFAAPSHSGG